MVPTAVIGGLLIFGGLAVLIPSVYQLGVTRASQKWQTGTRPRVGRRLAMLGVLIGVGLLSVGVTVIASLAPLRPPLQVAVAVVAAASTLALGFYASAKAADRIELNALIRTPSRARRAGGYSSHQPKRQRPQHDSEGRPAATAGPGTGAGVRPDPVVPPTAQPGWVFRDAGGAWYLVVSVGGGCRLVSLPDFRLAEPGSATSPVAVVGSVELAVWPLSQTPVVREGEA